MHEKNLRNLHVSAGVTDDGISVHLEDSMPTVIGSDCPCYSPWLKNATLAFFTQLRLTLDATDASLNNAFANGMIDIISKTENKIQDCHIGSDQYFVKSSIMSLSITRSRCFRWRWEKPCCCKAVESAFHKEKVAGLAVPSPSLLEKKGMQPCCLGLQLLRQKTMRLNSLWISVLCDQHKREEAGKGEAFTIAYLPSTGA